MRFYSQEIIAMSGVGVLPRFKEFSHSLEKKVNKNE